MRRLSKKQKKLLDKLAERGIYDIDNMPWEDFCNLKEMNDYETFWQDTNRYLRDKLWEQKAQE